MKVPATFVNSGMFEGPPDQQMAHFSQSRRCWCFRHLAKLLNDSKQATKNKGKGGDDIQKRERKQKLFQSSLTTPKYNRNKYVSGFYHPSLLCLNSYLVQLDLAAALSPSVPGVDNPTPVGIFLLSFTIG